MSQRNSSLALALNRAGIGGAERFDRILGLLTGVRKCGNQFEAHCPAHDDQHQSLTVKQADDGRTLVCCQRGCSFFDIAGAIGLEPSDFFPPRADPPRHSAGRVVARYVYRDETGQQLFEVERREPKSFRQRRPDGNGGYVWHLDCSVPAECAKLGHPPLSPPSVRRLLYRLPELLAAPADVPIFVVEGEKDVDRLAEVGLVATTNPLGARKWRDEYSESLKGKRVVVIPDNDQAGRSHAGEVVASLMKVGVKGSILELPGLPPKGDVSDWLPKIGSPEQLLELASEADKSCSQPEGPESLGDLLDELVGFIHRFVVLNADQAIACALWVAHTHVLDASDQTPYLWVTAPEKRCGKTRLLEVLALLVARPWLTGRTSPAAMVRKIDQERPTLMLDESDAAFQGDKDYAELLRGLLNTGHKSNGKYSACVGQGANITFRDFSTFSPKAIAGIGQLPDTVADRAIPIRLQRKAGSEQVERFRERKVRPQADPLSSRLQLWASRSVALLSNAEPELPEQMSDRAQDGAEPLFAIADAAGGEWPQRARQALIALFLGGTPDDDSLGVRLLSDSRSIFDSLAVDRVSSVDLCNALKELDESPWKDLFKGKGLTLRDLARRLNPFGVISGSIRLHDGRTPKGYYRSSFETAWQRYCPRSTAGSATAPQTNAVAPSSTIPGPPREAVVAEGDAGNCSAGAPYGAVAADSGVDRGPADENDEIERANQCGLCLEWRQAVLVQLDRSRIYLCVECRAAKRSRKGT
jgi:hypothetical protein